MARGRGRLRTIRVFLEMVRFHHTIFALPFAYLGMILAGELASHAWAGATAIAATIPFDNVGHGCGAHSRLCCEPLRRSGIRRP